MITWLAPWAFTGLALLAGPIVVHLLVRRNARRILFPATHFVRATRAAAIRFRTPSDVGLMLLRLAIVTAAVVAVAQPVVLTRWRLGRWNGRVSRAVVVDVSRSVSAPDVASRLAEEEQRTAFQARRIDTASLRDGIDRAVAWIETTSPSRREIVIVSDFQRGAIDREALRRVPEDVGIRTIRAGTLPGTRTETLPRVEGWRGGSWLPSEMVDAIGTRTSWVRQGSAPTPAWITVGASAADTAAAERALHAAISPGVPAGDDKQHLSVLFAGAPKSAALAEPIQSPWIAAAAQALKGSALLRDAGPEVAGDSLRIGEHAGAMVIAASAPASALSAAALIRAAILAVRPSAIADPEAEVVTTPDEELAQWRRDAAPVALQARPGADDSDARWLWVLALALIGVEAIVRRRRVRIVEGEAHADAA